MPASKKPCGLETHAPFLKPRSPFVSFVVQASQKSENKPLNDGFRMATEVCKESDLVSGCLEIIEDLCAVFGGNFFDGFDFENDLIKAEKIRPEGLEQRFAAIHEADFFLWLEGNAGAQKLPLQTFLINRFQEPRSHFPIDLKNSPLDAEALRSQNEFRSLHSHKVIEPRKTRKARKTEGLRLLKRSAFLVLGSRSLVLGYSPSSPFVVFVSFVVQSFFGVG